MKRCYLRQERRTSSTELSADLRIVSRIRCARIIKELGAPGWQDSVVVSHLHLFRCANTVSLTASRKDGFLSSFKSAPLSLTSSHNNCEWIDLPGLANQCKKGENVVPIAA